MIDTIIAGVHNTETFWRCEMGSIYLPPEIKKRTKSVISIINSSCSKGMESRKGAN